MIESKRLNSLGIFRTAAERVLREVVEQRIVPRIWEHDHTVWKPDPKEIGNRLGWLDISERMKTAIPEIHRFAEEVRKDGITHVLLLGMGGSSLAPEVFSKVFGVRTGYPDLSVLDSTDPGAVLEYSRRLKPEHTLYVVSTKSGGTVETLSFMKYFYNQAAEALGKAGAGNHFIAITDPGSSLEALAGELGFRKIFLNDPNIGGRFSALSYFGLVPAGLIGLNLAELLDRAEEMRCRCGGCRPVESKENPAAELGAILGELALQGRDKLTLILPPAISGFGAWLEQLIAESTGKDGKGILPVVGEELLTPGKYARDRLFLYLRLEEDSRFDEQVKLLQEAGHPVLRIDLKDRYDLGGEFFRWEFATAVAGWRLEINPFDQPNVESAKVLAREMVSAYRKEGKLPKEKPAFQEDDMLLFGDFTASRLWEALREFFSGANPGEAEGKGRSYLAIQAYLKPDSATDEQLHKLRTHIQEKYRLATTVGYGPRFLHSTGQLHKGDAGYGLFIQICADMPEDAPIPDRPGSPDSSITFGVLKTAQMLGDRHALQDQGRRVIAIQFHGAIDKGIQKLIDIIG